jgi:hypothetical protein
MVFLKLVDAEILHEQLLFTNRKRKDCYQNYFQILKDLKERRNMNFIKKAIINSKITKIKIQINSYKAITKWYQKRIEEMETKIQDLKAEIK